MTAILEGHIARRGNTPAGDFCPIDRAMQVVGTRSAILLMREAFYGTTRFDEFAARVGITEAVASTRLRELVGAGLLTREPYREPGQRTRQAYVLTESGRDLMPAVFALGQWARKHHPKKGTPQISHADCGEVVTVEMRCADNHGVSLDELTVTN